VFGGLPLNPITPLLSPDGPATSGTYTDGYISSLTSLESLVGTADCPWLLEVLPGQRINLTGFSFDWATVGGANSDWATVGGASSDCLYGLSVQELNTTTLIPMCALETRERHYYSSTTHRLKIFVQFFNDYKEQTQYHQLTGGFLVKYHGKSLTVLLIIG